MSETADNYRAIAQWVKGLFDELGIEPHMVASINTLFIESNKRARKETGAPKQGGASRSSHPPNACPECGSDMWDNREKKASGEFKPRSPDFTCKNCRHGVWLETKPAEPPLSEPDDDLPF